MYKYYKHDNERFCVHPDTVNSFLSLYPSATPTTRKEAVNAVRAERKKRATISKYATPIHIVPFPGAWYEPAYGYLYTTSDGVTIYPV